MFTVIWLVVEFTLDRDTAVVPDNWIVGSIACMAWWPPYKSMTRTMSAVRKKEVPGGDWTTFEFRELYRSGNHFS